MPILSEHLRSQFVDQLLKKIFGNAFEWENPILGETIGPSEPEIFDEFEKDRNAFVKAARERFEQIIDSDLEGFSGSRDDTNKALEAFGPDFLSDEIRRVSKIPPFAAAGFGHPHYRPDFIYWGQMEHYSLIEVINLSVGVDPKKIGHEKFKSLDKQRERGVELWPCFKASSLNIESIGFP